MPVGVSTNVVILLDVSGSMATNDGSGQSRLTIAKNAIYQMLDAYNSIANGVGTVNVKLTTFSTTATDYGWMSIAQAKAAVSALATGGYTNYEDALYKTYYGYTNPTADQTVAFFISDGEPTKENLEGRDVTGNIGLDAEDGWIDTPYKTGWNTFASTNLNELNVIGIGTGITNTTYLDKVAEGISDANTIVNTMLLKDPTELANMITPNVNIISGGATESVVYGADGIGGVISIQIGGTTYHASTPTEVTALNNGIDTGHGGVLQFDFATGTYTYTTNQYIASDYSETFPVTIQDGNGTQQTFDLNILIYHDSTTHTYTGDALDAGDGLDTLLFNSGVIDMSVLNNVHNIEKIDLAPNGNHTLNNLTYDSVFNMTDTNHTLLVFGDSGDTLILKDTTGKNWDHQTNLATIDGHVCDVYYGNAGDPTVKLYVEHTITHSIAS